MYAFLMDITDIFAVTKTLPGHQMKSIGELGLRIRWKQKETAGMKLRVIFLDSDLGWMILKSTSEMFCNSTAFLTLHISLPQVGEKHMLI